MNLGNRKGFEFEFIGLIGWFLAISLLLFLVYIFISEINTQIINLGLDNTPMETAKTVFVYYDYLIPTLFTVSILAAAFFASQVDTNPIFFVLSLLVWAIVIIYSAIQSDLFTFIASTPQMTSTVVLFPMTSYIMSNLPMFGLGGTAIITIALYAKWRTI